VKWDILYTPSNANAAHAMMKLPQERDIEESDYPDIPQKWVTT